MARPRKKVDPAKVKELAGFGLCTAEIAAALDVSHDTIGRRFKADLKAGREVRNGSLRRKQFEIAMAGNATMLIWLGKQHLDQSDSLLLDVPDDTADPKDKLRSFIGGRRAKQE
jgi:hypothetical protein